MPYIKLRKQADGSLRYTAIVRIRRNGKMLHQEAKTFTHRSAAERWGKHREVALENPTALARAQQPSTKLATLIRWYIDSFQHISKWQRSKQSQLLFLEKHPIGEADAVFLDSATLVDHIRARRSKGAGPAAVANDLTWIGVVLRAAKSVKGLPVNPGVVDEARNACRELRLIGKSRRRERRPTPEELVKLDAYFGRRDGRARVPKKDIMWFAIHSARRESEICRLEWTDTDQRGRTGLVRDAKHPRHKEGNHRRFKLTAEAWAIIEHQPKTSEYIFPYDPRSVSAAFTRACHVLGIQDLRFHDLRHEATSRLFERGYQIHEVAQFTLHESWNELKRYTNLRPEKVREIPQAASNADNLGEVVPLRTFAD
nr:site-specific integrase [uncultured Steroidobacter sp.]